MKKFRYEFKFKICTTSEVFGGQSLEKGSKDKLIQIKATDRKNGKGGLSIFCPYKDDPELLLKFLEDGLNNLMECFFTPKEDYQYHFDGEFVIDDDIN